MKEFEDRYLQQQQNQIKDSKDNNQISTNEKIYKIENDTRERILQSVQINQVSNLRRDWS